MVEVTERRTGHRFACAHPVSEGMIVKVNTPKVVRYRKSVMEYLLAHHPLDCPTCDKAGECSFALKEFEKAVESFMKSAEISFNKGFDRFGVSALDYAKDCQKALGNSKEVEELEKKIKEVKAKLESAF